MKHFLFTVDVVSKPRAAHQTIQISLWQVKRNQPIRLGKRNSQFESEAQALMNLAEDCKALPKEYFKPGPMGGMYYGPARLRELGVAQFHQL